MKAKEKSKCSICYNPINIGDEIGWVRRGVSAGYRYHSDCLGTKDEISTLSAIPESEDFFPVASEEVVKNTKVLKLSLPKLTKTSKWWEVLSHALQHLNRVVLLGPPGTGKSTTAINTCNIKFRVTMTESTTREDLIGMFHLINGDTKWVDGPVVQAMRQGEVVLIDEIDRYSQEVASMLYSILDDKPHVDLPTGEIIHAKEGYKVVMTSNELPEMLPAAIFDRIEGIFIANTPHEDAISHLSKPEQAVVTNFYRGLPVMIVKTTPTVRRMRAYYTLKSNGMQDHAAEIVFAGSYREIESALANTRSTVNV